MQVTGVLARLAVIALTVAGCAAVQPRSDEEVVLERAQARWDAMVRGDVATAYTFISPAGRATVSREAYEGRIKKGFWSSAKVEKVTCPSPDVCEAHLLILYDYLGAIRRSVFTEKWIKQDSGWWYLLES